MEEDEACILEDVSEVCHPVKKKRICGGICHIEVYKTFCKHKEITNGTGHVRQSVLPSSYISFALNHRHFMLRLIEGKVCHVVSGCPEMGRVVIVCLPGRRSPGKQSKSRFYAVDALVNIDGGEDDRNEKADKSMVYEGRVHSF